MATVLIALLGCSDEGGAAVDCTDRGAPKSRDASTGVPEQDAGLTCGLPACDGERQVQIDVCLGRGLPGTTVPSAGLYRACLVDPSSKLYVLTVVGDANVQTAGWTHSAWGGGNVPSNLSAADEARCELAILASPAGTPLSCEVPAPQCAAGTTLQSPGCSEPMPTWPKGCYASCAAVGDNANCATGSTCQKTWIDPCGNPEPGQATCAACGQETHLCLPAASAR